MDSRFDNTRKRESNSVVPVTPGPPPPRRRRSPVLLLLLLAPLLSGSGCMTVVEPGELEADEKLLEQAKARRDMGIAYLSNGSTAMALRELRFANETDPMDPVAWLWLGEGYRRRGHLDKALECMVESLTLDPGYHAAHLNLSGFYIQLERYEESITHSDILIEDAFFAQPWLPYSNKGWAQLQLGRMEEARESLELALEFHRKYWPASLNLGILEVQEGRRVVALDHFESVLRRSVKGRPNSETNFRMAQLYVSMGKRAKATEHFEASVESDPEGDWADQSRNYLKVLR